MSVTSSEVDLNELDPILGPVLASSNGSAESRVLALLVKGISSEVPVEPIRLWIKSRCVDGYMFGSASDSIGGRHGAHEQRGHSRSRRSRDIAHDMRSLAKSEGWGQLAESARDRVLSSSGEGRDVRGDSLDLALRIVAGVLMELPRESVLLKRNVGARAALMLIGLKMLSDDRAWDSVTLTYAEAGAYLGVEWRTPMTWLKVLSDQGVVTRPRATAFVPSRYRVKALTKKKLRAAREWDAVAEGLIDGGTNSVATVLNSVAHPAWTYSDKLGLTHWAMLLADTAKVDPATFGIRPRIAMKLRVELTAEYKLVPGVVVPYLDEILDRLADDIEYGSTDKATGVRITAREAKARAMAAYQEQALANKEAAQAATQMKKSGYAALDALFELMPIPKSPFGCKASVRDKRLADVYAWVDQVHQVILGEQLDEQARKVIARLLVKRLVKEWGRSEFAERAQAFADDVVPYIMDAEAGVTLEMWLSQASADDGSSMPSRRRG